MTRLLLLLGLAAAPVSCHTMAGPNGLPTLHPRERALYTTLRFAPGEDEIHLASLTRQRVTRSSSWIGEGQQTVELEVSLVANREGAHAFEATLELFEAATNWRCELQLPPRLSGRWRLELPPGSSQAWRSLEVEIEGDPYVEMERQRPPLTSSAKGTRMLIAPRSSPSEKSVARSSG